MSVLTFNTSELIDRIADGGIDEIVKPGVVLVLCGCSRERRKRCRQRRSDRSGCEIPLEEEDLFSLADQLREVKRMNEESTVNNDEGKAESFPSTDDQRMMNNVMRHNYRPLDEDEKDAMRQIKDLGLEFYDLLERIGQSRELSLAKTKIEEAVMWATKHVTR